jgi:hypothetical protein
VSELPPLIGRYEIISRLGQGGMGSLYLAKDPKIGRLVAIKLVRQEFDSPEARQRFAREAQSAGTLRHPNIVTIFDVDEHDGLPFIAMEYVDGETLGELIRRKAPMPLTRRLEWIEALCAGLAYAELWNVVRGDMSLVGPRPLLPQYLDRYTPEQARRHEVRPGITGWAQVNGRNTLTWEAKFAADVWYVDNVSVSLDMRILGLTLLRLLTREGISQPGQATAQEFMGRAD